MESKCEGTKYLAKAAREANANFMYISTDYVFNGEGDTPFLMILIQLDIMGEPSIKVNNW